RAMIEAPLGVLGVLDAGRREQGPNPTRDGRSARRGPSQLVRVRWKAVVVEQQRRACTRLDSDDRPLPVCRNHEQGAGLNETTPAPPEPLRHGVPRGRGPLGPLHEEAGAAAMRDIYAR